MKAFDCVDHNKLWKILNQTKQQKGEEGRVCTGQGF